MRLINEGKLDDDVKVIDIETDDGFAEFSKEVLKHGDAAVPSAFKDGKQCKILIENGKTIILDCPSAGLHK
jgi:aminoglycoside phosphotransferase